MKIPTLARSSLMHSVLLNIQTVLYSLRIFSNFPWYKILKYLNSMFSLMPIVPCTCFPLSSLLIHISNILLYCNLLFSTVFYVRHLSTMHSSFPFLHTLHFSCPNHCYSRTVLFLILLLPVPPFCRSTCNCCHAILYIHYRFSFKVQNHSDTSNVQHLHQTIFISVCSSWLPYTTSTHQASPLYV